MIRSFRDSATQDVFDGRSSKKARRVFPLTLWDVAARKLELRDSVITLDELRIPPRNRLEAPKGGRGGHMNMDRKKLRQSIPTETREVRIAASAYVRMWADGRESGTPQLELVRLLDFAEPNGVSVEADAETLERSRFTFIR